MISGLTLVFLLTCHPTWMCLISSCCPASLQDYHSGQFRMSASESEVLEQSLHVSRCVDVFQIPPRGPTGFRSGEWLVSSKIFSGRLRVVSKGLDSEVRLEDANTEQLFATCPIAYGMRTTCVEPVMDSSRYFVIRVEDPVTKRHAFLGMGFTQREEAFDFNDALIRHEKYVEREKAIAHLAPAQEAAGAAGAGVRQQQPSVQAAAATQEMAVLYQHRGDLSIKDGQTIHVNVKPTKAAPGKSSWLASAPAVVVPPVVPTQSGLFKLAPPPSDAHGPQVFSPAITTTATPPASHSSWQPSTSHQSAAANAPAPSIDDLLGLDAPLQAPSTAPRAQADATQQPAAQALPQTDWAVFD